MKLRNRNCPVYSQRLSQGPYALDLVHGPSGEVGLRTKRARLEYSSSSFHQDKYKSGDPDVELVPSKHNGKLVHLIDAAEDSRLEFVKRGCADMAQEGARHF